MHGPPRWRAWALLVLVWGATCSYVARACGHHAVRAEQEEVFRRLLSSASRSEETSQQTPQTRLQRLLATTQPGTLRITPIYQLNGSYMLPAQHELLQTSLVPGAINVLQKYIKVRIPSSRKVRALRTVYDDQCGAADASVVFHGDGFENTDMVFYITAMHSGACGGRTALAYTLVCHMEPFTYRPNVANLNLCPAFWADVGVDSRARQVATLVHEMTHGLGFMDNLYTFYYDLNTGKQYDDVTEVEYVPGTRTASAIYITTPRVKALARSYFKCPTLPGAPADVMSGGSHWEQTALNHELMQPATSEDGQRKRMTAFTLQFLADTGWYVTEANGSAAQELEWGRDAGCSFVQGNCSAFIKEKPLQPFFCPKENEKADVCTADNRGIGVCTGGFRPGCNTATSYIDRPVILCRDPGTFSLAEDAPLYSGIMAMGDGIGFNSSRCITTPDQICIKNSSVDICLPRKATCVQMCCPNGQLSVTIGNETIACPAGSTIELTKRFPDKFKSGSIKCPDPDGICPTLRCGKCVNGDCWKGKCYCYMEYTGWDCSQSLVPPPPSGWVEPPRQAAASSFQLELPGFSVSVSPGFTGGAFGPGSWSGNRGFQGAGGQQGKPPPPPPPAPSQTNKTGSGGRKLSEEGPSKAREGSMRD